MRVLITGSEGFIGSNLKLKLSEREDVEVLSFDKEDTSERLAQLVAKSDFVFHLAGVNRPKDPAEFFAGNADLTAQLSALLAASERGIPVVYTSSIQAELNNSYGQSKRSAEQNLADMACNGRGPAFVFRLPNVFGKWARPNYNSAVATFCHNIARDLPIQVNDPDAPLKLVYIDDVVDRFVELMDGATSNRDESGFERIEPIYETTVGFVADTVRAFHGSRDSMVTERVGTGLVRALYSTYVSYLPTDRFSYEVPSHGDARGVFVEMLRTPDCGQFSFFTAHPGVTRGGHYHHSKTEKFLVIKGKARFRFRHMLTGEASALDTDGKKSEIVETVPGWTHDITNIGSDELIVMLWANEIFDRQRPDTYACPL